MTTLEIRCCAAPRSRMHAVDLTYSTCFTVHRHRRLTRLLVCKVKMSPTAASARGSFERGEVDFGSARMIIPNAGEVRVSRRGSLRILSIWAASLAPKTRVLWIGAGVPGNSTVWAIPYKLLARRAKLATFRDTESTELLQYGGVTPDWAFLLGAGVDEWVGLRDRKKLAIVLRGDRGKPSDEWLGWVKMLTETLSLTPVFVAQVRRDNELAVELAGKLHGEALQFGDAVDHATQEAYVRETYSETRLVIGDRLHGLIVAATEGAVPLGWVESSTGKIRRHFNAAKMPFVGEFEGAAASELPAVSNVQLLEWRATLEARVAEARDEINATLVSADRVAERSAVTG